MLFQTDSCIIYYREIQMNILFIGNSFTYFNSMPSMLSKMARENGIENHIEQITCGGYFLHDYIPGATRGKGSDVTYKLEEAHWDYVILQDQSSNPAVHPDEFLQVSKQLCDQINATGSKVVFYQTWAYRDGSEKLKKTELSYEQLYQGLKDAYEKAASDNGAMIVPVGTAFKSVKDSVDLYREDDFHPNLKGSYLIACMFYRALFKTDKKPGFVPEGLDKDTADSLWNVAQI